MRRVAAALAAVVGLVVAGAGGSALAARQQQAGPGELIERLMALEQGLPALPPRGPGEVALASERTWADLSGDFVGARIGLERVVEEGRMLFIDAAEADDPAAAAVAQAARALVELHEAYGHLAAWESHDLDLLVGAPDGTDASTFADELYGRAEVGVRILTQAHLRRLVAYTVLRDAGAASDAAKDHFEARLQDQRTFVSEVLPQLRRALSQPTTRLLVPVDRFSSGTRGSEARARSMTVVCVDRGAYMADRATNAAAVASLPAAEQAPPELAVLAGLPAADCPALPLESSVTAVP